jgi:hypothetical protein
MFMSYPATAGTYGWGSVASPSRIAGTKLTGVVSIQEVAGTNGIVQQFFVRTDGSPRVRTLAVGKQTAAIPPTGTPVSGNLGKLGWIYGTPFTGSSFHGSTSVAGGTVYFSGVACTDEWICYKGVYLQKCMDAACSKYLIPEGAITFEEPAGIQIDTQGAVASLDGWVFLLKVEVDKNNTKSYGVWARDVKAGLPAKRLATGVVGSILLSEKMELEPGLGGQVTIVFPEKQRAFLYIPDQEKWNPLP